MFRKHLSHQRSNEPHQLDITPFLNLMVALVPFLLVTAVFSRVTILELNLPSAAGGPANNQDNFRVEVIVREAGMEISNGSAMIASIPKKDEEYDLESLSELIVELKREYPNQEEASVLMEPRIPYDYLIQVMDVVRSIEVPTDVENEFELYALFSDISVGDAP